MNKTQEANGLWAIDTDADHILHRIGSDDYSEIRRAMVKAPDEWEEVAVADIPPYPKAQYDAEVERLIAERYSHGKEIEINREHDTKPERFAEYMAYVEECKVRAKVNLTEIPEDEAKAEMERREREAAKRDKENNENCDG